MQFQHYQKQANYKSIQHDQRIDQVNMDLFDIRKDIDIKFGSKNLLSFAGAASEKEAKQEDDQKIVKMIESKFTQCVSMIE